MNMNTATAHATHLPAARAGGSRIARKPKRTAGAEIEEIEDVEEEQSHDYPRPEDHVHHDHDEKEGHKNRRERRKSGSGSYGRPVSEPVMESPAYTTPMQKTMHIKQPAGRGLN
ncbi:hypothetical protein E3P86_03282 [Wallemia ichthyophaga]|uniref:Uncharacterized protein n=1 Tax=Wallemia ichthyophaga TaxID=245174 RepID=A0A4T0IQG5_WALIC|nr:hypothetical protein E3P86_03282 [Wallemia ichthyophaga]